MKKIDIMNERDLVAPGEDCKWQIIDGKVKKIEEFIPVALVVEKKVIEDLKEKLEESKKMPVKKKPKKVKNKW